MKQYIVLIGNYGSGKTELAMNLAFNAAEEGKIVRLIDLDRINDYFRLSDHARALQEKQIKVVSPTFVGAAITQTNMPAEVMSAFAGDEDLVIFDVGGDPAGALALARYAPDFEALEREQLTVCDVVNIRRPMSETPAKLLKLKDDMESFARLKVNAFINNSNLLQFSSAEDLRLGYEVLLEASKLSGIPVLYTSGREEHLKQFLAGSPDMAGVGKPLVLKEYMHRSVDDFTQNLSNAPLRGSMRFRLGG